MRRRRTRYVAAALVGLLAGASAAAQTTGSIQGVVRDAAGGALGAADVMISSTNLQGARTVRTGPDGRFWLPALPPGPYTVTAALAGFRPETRSVVVSLDAKTTVEIQLSPSVSETVAVSGEAPLIDASSTTGGTNYTKSVIDRLPVDRNYASIVRSNPGVDTDRGDTQGRSLALTVYGATSAENQWIIDGVNTTNAFMGIQGKSINNEFVQEVEVKTDGYAAEYGRALGGVVNVITKSGGNQFHGDGFFYFDDSATSAAPLVKRSEIDPATPSLLADYQRLDFGADLGGFLLKDRLWFFAAYDRVDYSGHVSPVKDTNHVTTAERFPLDETDNLWSGKLTWNAGPSTTIVASVFADPTSASGAAGADPRLGPSGRVVDTPVILNRDPSTWSSTRVLGGTDYGLRANQLFGTNGLAQVQGAYHQDRNLVTAPAGVRIQDDQCNGGMPEAPCVFPNSPNDVEGGYGWIDGQKDHNLSHTWGVRGSYTFYAGAHELKAGADYADVHSNMTYAVSGGQLVTIRNELGKTYDEHLFAAVSPTDLTILPNGSFLATLQSIGAYVQDSWRASSNLTVNVGLRWDNEFLDDYRGVRRLALTNQWQPRLGVIWDPSGDGRTKIYASAGRFDFAMPSVAMTWWFSDVSAVETYNFDRNSVTPDPAAGNVTTDTNTNGVGLFYGGGPFGTPSDPGLREMYQDEFTLGAERLLDPTFTVGIKASYRRLGNAIEDRCDFLDASGNPSCAIINPGSGEPYARGVGSCEEDPEVNVNCPGGPVSPPARRTYKGLELLARKSFGTSAWVQASYVWSSLRGNYDGAINEQNAGVVPGRNTDFDFAILWHDAYGRLFLDRPDRFRLDGYWTAPFGLTTGLQFFVESGTPYDRLGYFDGYGSVVYLVPRGSAGRMPTQWEANLSLAYPIAVGPATVTLQAYVFNVFNNQIALTRDNVWDTGPTVLPNLDPNQPKTNRFYGEVTSRQPPRTFRAAVRVSF
jgi:outer membrane receptor protein involved in Fe transport